MTKEMGITLIIKNNSFFNFELPELNHEISKPLDSKIIYQTRTNKSIFTKLYVK